MNKRKDNKTRINGVRVRDIQHPEQSKHAKIARRQAKLNAKIEAEKARMLAEAEAKKVGSATPAVTSPILPPVKLKATKPRKAPTQRARQALKGAA